MPPPELPPADRPILPRPPALAPKPSATGSRHSPPLPPRVPPARDPGDYPTNVKPLNPREPYENNETLRKVRHSHDNIPFESIHVKDAIGEGEFGSVYKAVYMNEKGMIRWGSLNQSYFACFFTTKIFFEPKKSNALWCPGFTVVPKARHYGRLRAREGRSVSSESPSSVRDGGEGVDRRETENKILRDEGT